MRGQKGFSLIEVMVALFLVSITTLGFAHSFIATLRMNTQNELRSAAMAAAQQILDQLRTVDPSTLPASGSTTSNVDVGGRNFVVQVAYCTMASYCTTSSVRTLATSVTYRGDPLYAVDTIFTQLK